MKAELMPGDAILLERAAEKLVAYGEDVGVTPEEMINLLNEGMSVTELIAYVISRGTVQYLV